MAKYRNFVTRDHVVLENYDQAIAIGRAPKALILDFNTTDVMNAALDQIPYGTFNMFRGSPDPFFVEFLNPQASKGELFCHLLVCFACELEYLELRLC
jgi:hypothetical protein